MSLSKPLGDDPPTCLGLPPASRQHASDTRRPLAGLRPTNKWGDDARRVLAQVARNIRARVHSTEEVRRVLRARRVRPVVIGQVVREWQARGWLDDRACARLWAEHWARRGYAWRAIRARLAAKGLDDAASGHAAQALSLASDDEARAQRLVASRLGRGRVATGRVSILSARRKRGLARTLAGRGFDPQIIVRVLGIPDES